jgi:ATP-dependent DNA ligase
LFEQTIVRTIDLCFDLSAHGHKSGPAARWRKTKWSIDMAWAKHAANCGMTLEQIRDGLLNGRDLSKKGSAKRQLEYVLNDRESFTKPVDWALVIDRTPIRVRPMLALLVSTPFDRPGWVFEEKYDGIRILAYKEGPKVTLLSRNDLDRTATFSDIAAAVGQLRDRTLILDGEVVALDPKGV